MTAWAASRAHYLSGLAVREGHRRPFWSWPTWRAVAWSYSHLVDMLTHDGGFMSAKLQAVITQVDLHLEDPFIITDDNWGTSPRAVAGQQAWEAQFPTQLPPRKPVEEPPAS